MAMPLTKLNIKIRRASKLRGPTTKVYNIFNIVIGLSHLCCHNILYSDTPVSSTNKTDRCDITEILLKVALNTIIQALTCIIVSINMKKIFIVVIKRFQ
jgi:hypothetical protein